ncbi:MAG: carboxypeptidase-like regulatory domain-containing protein, partial [Bacteroidales bacterium]
MKKTLYLLLILTVFVNIQLMAQSLNTVSGIVKDKDTGEELIGVNVRVDGTTNGTITDFDGRFSLLNVNKNAILSFSYIGMKPVSVKVVDFKPLTILMQSDATGLDEVVVVGYGTSKKRDLTGSIVSVSGDDLKTSPDYNPVKSLQGKVPGLMITNSGSAGGAPTIRLRGVATVNASTNPLYVVDGMFVDNIDFVNPNDIVSIEVLKDPSSLAIFGVQGANGVIILSTRRAEKGKISLNYDGYAGVQMLHQRDRLKLTNASEFTMLYNEQLQNEATTSHPYQEWTPDLLGKGTDWQAEILRPAFVTNHGLTVSSASEKASSILSLGYFKQEGIVKYNDY